MLSLPSGAFMGTPLCPNWKRHGNTDAKLDEFTQEHIESIILNCIRCVQGHLTFADTFTYRNIVQILHRMADLFESEPMLIEVLESSLSVTVIGTLYGDALQLFDILNHLKLSSKTYFVFLGNYVGSGPHQLELIVFLFALKMRFKEQIIMLRGATEVLYDFENNKGFFEEVQKKYPHWDQVFLEIHQVFDLMPVAAIIGNYLFLSGGVSQWMTRREVINNIPKPTYLQCMKFLHGCILADIFFGKPTHLRKQVAEVPPYGVIDDMFYPSDTRSAGYDFGFNGLLEILEQLHCRILIRSSGELRNNTGCNDFFGNGRCYEIASTVGYPPRGDCCAVMQLNCDATGDYSEQQSIHFDSVEPLLNREQICEEMFQSLKRFFSEASYIPIQHFQDPCRRCQHILKHKYSPKKFGARITSHRTICDWMSKDGLLYLVNDQTYQLAQSKRRVRSMMMRQLEMFPVCYDMLDTAGYGTYRSMITSYERPIIVKYFNLYKYADPDVIFLEHSDALYNNQSLEVGWDMSTCNEANAKLRERMKLLERYVIMECEKSSQPVPMQWSHARHLEYDMLSRQAKTTYRTEESTLYPVLRKVNCFKRNKMKENEMCEKTLSPNEMHRDDHESINGMMSRILHAIRRKSQYVRLFFGRMKIADRKNSQKV